MQRAFAGKTVTAAVGVVLLVAMAGVCCDACPFRIPGFSNGICLPGSRTCTLKCPQGSGNRSVHLLCPTTTDRWVLSPLSPHGCLVPIAATQGCQLQNATSGIGILCKNLRGIVDADRLLAGLPRSVVDVAFLAAPDASNPKLNIPPHTFYFASRLETLHIDGFSSVSFEENPLVAFTWQSVVSNLVNPGLYISLSIYNCGSVRGLGPFLKAFTARKTCVDNGRTLQLINSHLEGDVDPHTFAILDRFTAAGTNVHSLPDPTGADHNGDGNEDNCCLSSVETTDLPLHNVSALPVCFDLTFLKLFNAGLTKVPSLPPFNVMEQVILTNNNITEVPPGAFESTLSLTARTWDQAVAISMDGNPTTCHTTVDSNGFPRIECSCPAVSLPVPACPPSNTITCGSGESVPVSQRCDGARDCADGSDERLCTAQLFTQRLSSCPQSIDLFQRSCLQTLGLSTSQGVLALEPIDEVTGDAKTNCTFGAAVFSGAVDVAVGAFSLSSFTWVV